MKEKRRNSAITGGEVKITERLVGPELARLLLANNSSNRPLNAKLVLDYARDMENGAWMSNGETIKLGAGGLLIDGQHRLSAVIKSGAKVKMLIVEHLPVEAFSTVDIGMRRTAGQQLSIGGYKNANVVASIGRWVVSLSREKNDPRSGATTPEILEALDSHPLIQKYANTYQSGKLKQIVPSSAMAVCVLAAEKYGEDVIDQFITDLANGEGISKGDPAFELRERMIQNKGSVAKLQTITIVGFMIKAITAFRLGKKIGVLRIMAAEAIPEI